MKSVSSWLKFCCAFQGHRVCIHTGCLMKNASTHNFVIYYPISMNKKIKDMVFQALQNSYKMVFFLALSSIANDSQLFFLNGHM
jgi:azurin